MGGSKYVAKWKDRESGKWFPVDWLDIHTITEKQVEIVRRSFNKSFGKEGINQHVSAAMGHRVWFVKCRIVNRNTRKLVYRSK
jgi:hypothetical protein